MKFKFALIGAVAGVIVAYIRTSKSSPSSGAMTGPAAFRGAPTGGGYGG